MCTWQLLEGEISPTQCSAALKSTVWLGVRPLQRQTLIAITFFSFLFAFFAGAGWLSGKYGQEIVRYSCMSLNQSLPFLSLYTRHPQRDMTRKGQGRLQVQALFRISTCIASTQKEGILL